MKKQKKELPELEEKKGENKIVVVTEIPKQDIREFVDDKNETYSVLTVDEALTEIYNDVKEMKKILKS